MRTNERMKQFWDGGEGMEKEKEEREKEEEEERQKRVEKKFWTCHLGGAVKGTNC